MLLKDAFMAYLPFRTEAIYIYYVDVPTRKENRKLEHVDISLKIPSLSQ